ncbi:four helix bundle protein [Spirosoma luteolum]
MATVQRFEDLKTWQSAREVARLIYQLSQTTSLGKDFELRNQISRSSGSVMDNIAEGFGRGSRTEFIQFLGYAMGSNDEVKSQLYRSLDRGHLTPDQFAKLYEQVDIVGKMLVSFITYLKRSDYKGFKYKTPTGVDEPAMEAYRPLIRNNGPQTTNNEPENPYAP